LEEIDAFLDIRDRQTEGRTLVVLELATSGDSSTGGGQPKDKFKFT